MPWVIGIDEAGYGPNLGPFVQVGVCLNLPKEDLAGWTHLAKRIHLAGGKSPGRVLVDDSKKVYGPTKNLSKLATAFPLMCPTVPESLADWLNYRVGGTASVEDWWQVTETLPEIPREIPLFPEAGPVALNVVTTAEFNRVVEVRNTKGEVPAMGVAVLLQSLVAQLPGEDGVIAFADKLGGRNEYGGILSEAFPECWPVTERESATESRYRLLNLPREITVIFRPRAEGGSVAVALASMLAKYTREVFMQQFNRYWMDRVPGLLPTAGYPMDAKRFYQAIRGVMEAEGWHEDYIWRCR
jgi:hypothetical protein